MKKPRILILTTGGTIVSSGNSAMQMTGYEITDFSVEKIVASVPGIENIAELTLKEVSNIDSSSMTSTIWVELLQAIHQANHSGDFDGIVITHGTDTMEETAYFLDLTSHSSIPIVLTGAMRPATAFSADGPINLVDSVRVASKPEVAKCGVVICLNSTIISAREATKTHPTRVDTFQGRPTGAIGYVCGEDVCLLNTPNREVTPFNLEDFSVGKKLPRVEILYCHADDDSSLVDASVAAGAKAIVLACTGNGSIHEDMEASLIRATQAQVAVIRASRTINGSVIGGLSRWEAAGFIPARSLNPQKARILAQLVINKFGSDKKVLAKAFKLYGY